MTLLTVSLSVLIFAFFYLIYANMLTFGEKLGDDLSLIVYLEEEPGPELSNNLPKKSPPSMRLKKSDLFPEPKLMSDLPRQLGPNQDVLNDMPKDFLPPSIEVIPLKNLRSLNQVKLFSAYLSRLPGTLKVQYGQDWVERFYYFTKLLSIIVLLSGTLLILTTIFMVAYTIRLHHPGASGGTGAA
jgi:cell division transport system permease protein